MLTIRRYEAADRDAVADLHIAALPAGNNAGRGPWDADIDDIEGVYLGSGDFLVGHVDGVLTAMGALKPSPPGSIARAAADEAFGGPAPTAELKRMRVRPGQQRRGYGEAILVALLARCTELGYQRAVLDTVANSAAAIGLYRKHGFTLTGFTTMFNMECVLLARDLGPAGALSSGE